MSTANIKFRTLTTKYDRGFFGLIYGRPGVGKTSLLAKNKRHFFMGNELNSEFQLNGFEPVESWNEFLAQCEKLKSGLQEIKKKFDIVVVDNFSDIEGMMKRDFLGATGNLSTWNKGWGAGTNECEKKTRALLDDFVRPLNKEGLGVIFICHSKNNPKEDHITSIQYTEYAPELEFKTLKPLEAYAKFIFHIHTPIDLKAKGGGSLNRVLFTASKAGSSAKKKVSIDLPDEVELNKDKIKETWDIIYKKVK